MVWRGEEGKGMWMEPFWGSFWVQDPITCVLLGGRCWGQCLAVPHFVVSGTKIRLFHPKTQQKGAEGCEGSNPSSGSGNGRVKFKGKGEKKGGEEGL